MILGILSDSHGRLARTVRALEGLQRHGAAHVVHCGDIGTPEVLTQLVARHAHFVWGNNDEPDIALIAYARNLQAAPPGVPLRVRENGHEIAVFHGHEREFWRVLTAAEDGKTAVLQSIIGSARVVLFGHTHYPEDRTIGGVRFINPGALHRAAVFTVATLDLNTAALQFWVVRDDREDLEPYTRLRT